MVFWGGLILAPRLCQIPLSLWAWGIILLLCRCSNCVVRESVDSPYCEETITLFLLIGATPEAFVLLMAARPCRGRHETARLHGGDRGNGWVPFSYRPLLPIDGFPPILLAFRRLRP